MRDQISITHKTASTAREREKEKENHPDQKARLDAQCKLNATGKKRQANRGEGAVCAQVLKTSHDAWVTGDADATEKLAS